MLRVSPVGVLFTGNRHNHHGLTNYIYDDEQRCQQVHLSLYVSVTMSVRHLVENNGLTDTQLWSLTRG